MVIEALKLHEVQQDAPLTLYVPRD
jgi:hypothetical protein